MNYDRTLPCIYCGKKPAFIKGMGLPFYACINKDCEPTNDKKALKKWNEQNDPDRR